MKPITASRRVHWESRVAFASAFGKPKRQKARKKASRATSVAAKPSALRRLDRVNRKESIFEYSVPRGGTEHFHNEIVQYLQPNPGCFAETA
jgi:hypothetical protein